MHKPFQAIIPAPFGVLGVRMEAGQLTGVEFLPRDTPLQAPTDALLNPVCAQLCAYLKDASIPLQVPLPLRGTPFQRRVWQAICTIPVGATLTYAELAELVGSGPRAVANACGANPVPLVIPCHRVVAKHGIGGFMQGREADSLLIKQWLLQHERRNPTAA